MISIKAAVTRRPTLRWMNDRADIRAQIAADSLLQAEINRALQAIADNLSQGCDPRVVRILNRTLEASWAEHVSFQDEVVFPIILGRHTRQVALMIDRLRSEHAGLAERHAEVGSRLNGVLQDQPDDTAELDVLLRTTLELRRLHLLVDAELIDWLPASFTAAEVSLCCAWASRRPNPRFPLNLLKSPSRRSFRLGGGRLH
jgi:hypothetical protein